MRQVSFSGKSVEIDFNAFLYPRKLLEETARQLGQACEPSILEKSQGRILVRLREKGGFSLREAAFGFCNHALALRQGWD